MYINDKEILLYYNDSNTFHKEAVAIAHAESSYVKAYKFTDAEITPIQWQQILDRLQLTDVSPLFDPNSDWYAENIKEKNYSQDDWLKLLVQHADKIRYAIGLSGKKAVIVKTGTDVQRLIDTTALYKDLGRDDVERRV